MTEVAQVLGVHHVSVLVRDAAQSQAFYQDVLGLELLPRPDLGFPGVWLALGAQQLHLLQLDNPDPVGGRPVHVGRDRHMALHVTSLEPFIARLQARGVAYTRSRSGRAAIFLRDPDGNGIELVAA